MFSTWNAGSPEALCGWPTRMPSISRKADATTDAAVGAQRDVLAILRAHGADSQFLAIERVRVAEAERALGAVDLEMRRPAAGDVRRGGQPIDRARLGGQRPEDRRRTSDSPSRRPAAPPDLPRQAHPPPIADTSLIGPSRLTSAAT